MHVVIITAPVLVEEMRKEFTRKLNEVKNKQRMNVRRIAPNVYISGNSEPSKVQEWLKAKEFSDV